MEKHYSSVKNIAQLRYSVCGKMHTLESNEVEAKLVKLRLIKEQSCLYAASGDKLCYKVTICNDSGFSIYDADFIDCIDEGLCYERDSFTVNGDKKRCELKGRNLYYHIDELKCHGDTVITFETKVL